MRSAVEMDAAPMAVARTPPRRSAHAFANGGPPATGTGPLPPSRAGPATSFVDELEFVGCDPVPVNYDQYVLLREAKRRIELWDRDAGMAWEVRDGPSGEHEWPIQALKEMMVLLGIVRGIHVPCFGNRGLAVLDERSMRARILHPDQTVYMAPPVRYDGEGDIPVDKSGYPNIVMEVDHTTNTRRGKLKLYEAMGVPELWIEVPEIWSRLPHEKRPRRPAGLVPGLSIFLLENGRYREVPASRALLGWKATEIHQALNDLNGASSHVAAVLEDIGRRMGTQTGTGPDDHPLMRSLREESREEGRAAGRRDSHAKAVRQVLKRRGIAMSKTSPADVPNFANTSLEDLLDAAMACESEEDFRTRLR